MLDGCAAHRHHAFPPFPLQPPLVPPDSMKTNVPFQAPGINAPPRGRGQEQGTSPKQVFKDIKEQVKENFRE